MSVLIDKIENILKSSYNIKKYIELIKEIFPKANIVSLNKFNKEFTNFSSHIEGSTYIGNYETIDKKNIIIMSVELKKAGYVENSRSTQRSYAKKLIENANADAAFIAFYTEGDTKWRISFVRLDYEIKLEKGSLKTKENLTPAKRYSYLLGENEPCHTAISQFEKFISISELDSNHPTLDDLEDAFSVEKVTDEFFKLYCDKFHQLRESLENNEDFRIEAEHHNFTSAQFAKKLMGQIVFLYFLQKKGWLGVKAWPNTLNEKEYKNAYYSHGAKSRELIPIVYKSEGNGIYRISNAGLNSISDEDEEILAMCVKGNPWGSGPQNFMRKLFNISERKGQNFFDELLEPLFYDALNVNRGEQGYCPILHCRIPFLSGGLFEPIDGYDWKHNNFDIPNEIFSNVSTKGREADGILDIFDRYNFTMSEDEPMEREVAIDPEMLGKVFENLLEVNDRKSKGAFYTPREIVHYMCQESLINYLVTTLQLEEVDVRDFILYGDFMKDEDTVKDKRQGNKEMYISENLYKIDSDGNVVVDRLKDIDKALENVKVADPAVGSGAFPLGMLNEIVRARQNISAYMSITMNPYDTRMMYQLDRSPHNLKYETIKNCIFAADIDPSAVDITQLRLWLSLVIDDEINPNFKNWQDGHKNPLPLPNLESNIICGNTLIDEFEGTKLIKESDIFSDSTYQMDITHTKYESVVKKLIKKQNDLFCCNNTNDKKMLKEEIEDLKDMIILSQLENCDYQKIQRYNDSKRNASKPYLLWELDFARVFIEKGGFDIVIGNPPYIDSENMVEQGLKEQRRILSKKFKMTKGNWDIYIAFFEKAWMLLNDKGVITYITPDKWISKPFGEEMRKQLLSNFKSILVAGRNVFKSATVDSIITIITKENQEKIEYLNLEEETKKIKSIRSVKKDILTSPYSFDIIFSDSLEIISKLEMINNKLKDFYKCENACSTSDCYKLKEILYSLNSEDEFNEKLHYKVINTGTIGRYISKWGKQEMKYLKDKYKYPVVNKSDFHNLFPKSYGEKAKKEKIIIKGLTLLDSCMDSKGLIIPGKATLMVECNGYNDILYLMAIINSKLMFYFIKQKYSSSSYNGGINFSKDMINSLPWKVTEETYFEIVNLVKKILLLKENEEESEVSVIDEKINQIIYKIYGLTENEIKIIENIK